jgi:hypothetical protein
MEGGHVNGGFIFEMVRGSDGWKGPETMIGKWWSKRNAGKFLFLWVFLFLLGSGPLAGAAEGPLIRMDETIYTFPPVFEGEKVSHTFTVFNRGDGVLHIRKVHPS